MARDAARLVERFPALSRLGFASRRSIRFVPQLTETECGAACLAMVLGHLGKEVSLEAVRDACAAGRDGVTARDLVEGGARLGVRGRGVKAELGQLALLPAGTTILHWEMRHFVVLGRVSARAVEIVDPAVGRRSVPLAEVGKAFSGIALVFEPNDLFREQRRGGVLYPVVKDLVLGSGLWKRILLVSLVLQLFGLALPVLTGQVIDRVLPRGDLGLLAVMLVGLGVLVLFRGIGQLVRGHLLLHLGTLLDARMTLGFLDHLADLPCSFFQARGAGDLMMRLNSNALIRERLTSAAMSAVLDGLLVVVYVGVLALGSGPLAAMAVVAGALDVGGFLLVRGRQRQLAREELLRESRTQSYEVEMFTAMETLKAMGCEQRAVGHWSNLFVGQLNVRLRRERLTIQTDAALGALRVAGPLAILATGAVEVLRGHLTLGAMLALAAVAGSFLQPLSSLVQALLSLETVRGYLARVNDVLDAEPEQRREEIRLIAPRLSGRIELEKVSFGYHPTGPLVVCDASLKIAPGQFVAIVGRSGSGKTTLANLILGLQRPASGRVLFDGIDARTLDLRSVRQQIGVVNQSFSLFASSVRENISLADPTRPLAGVEEAARLACIHDDIVILPLGYETPLADRGSALSGGQRQRLALARALVRQPSILLLDEATSALDAATERQVQESLERLACTRIVIAHRLSTIRRADLILVMEAGAIVEAGDHPTLLARGGAYAHLVGAQLEGEDRSRVGSPR